MPRKDKANGEGRAKKRIRWGRILLFLFSVMFLAVMIGGVLVAGWVFSLAKELPEITAQELAMNQTSFVYDKDGGLLGTLHAGENREVLELSEMPQLLIDTLLASEDIRFYEHFGVDVRSVARAVWVDTRDTIKNRKLTFTQGASTLTMQLVRNVVADVEETMERKVKEALLAMQFEKKYDKDEILYLYMNEIYLGPRVYGFAAAAEYYFGKKLKDITLAEAALMVGVLRNANYYSPYQQPERALNIRNTVLNSVTVYFEDEYGDAARAAMKEPIVLSETVAANLGVDYKHEWFVDYVLTEASGILTSLEIPVETLFTGGLSVYTTLDLKVQEAMEQAYADEANFMESKTGDIVESGMAIIRPSTGEIAGLVGGRMYETRRGFNRATSMQRQPGSTIKPIVAYGPAVDLGYGPGTIIDDSPFTGNYNPNNSDHTYQGRITMRKAIAGSRNVCAVKMLQTIGTQVGWQYAVNMGLPLDESDAYNSAMALGGVARGVSPLDMAGAFSTYANNGIYTKPYCVAKIVDVHGNTIYEADPLRRQVVSPQTAYLMTDMLTTAVAAGTGGNARLANWPTAGKTGTVELPSAKEDPDYAGKRGTKDIWFAGYTPELCGVVWMGYDNKKDADGNIQYMPTVFGGGAPAKLWKSVMTICHEGLEVKQFSRPSTGLASISIDLKSGLLPSDLTPADFYGSELFNAAHVPTEKSDIWTVVEICADTNNLATDFCPNKTTAVKMRVEEGVELSTKVADYGWYAPVYYCTEHTTMQGNLNAAYICTDPLHGVERVLANVPGFGGSGGCPSEYVSLRYYGAASMPSKYCALAGHEISGGVSNPFQPPIGGDSGGTTGGSSGGSTGGSSGSSGGYATDEVGAPILQTPYSLAAYPSTNGCLLSWTADNDPFLTTYRIQKITDGDEATEIRYSVNGYSFDDNYVEAGHTYTYRVYAYNETYNVTSGWSQSVSFTP